MSVRSTSCDDCPNCRQRLEILLLKFKLATVQMIIACPNCAMICDGPETSVAIQDIFKTRALSIQSR
jgi:hypothetical protein